MSEARQDELCVQCETELYGTVMQCTGCGVEIHKYRAIGDLPRGLGFWFCDKCSGLDDHDLACNTALLMLLAEYPVDNVITSYGFSWYERASEV